MPVLALLLTIALAAASCGSDSQTSTSVTTDPPETTTSSTTADATTIAPPTSGSTSPPLTTALAVNATDDPRCATGAEEADVDDDGTADRVVHTFVDGNAVLRLCASSAGYQELPGLGMAEQLQLVDIELDESNEILYGATAAGSAGYFVAVVDNGVLTAVTTEAGDPFVLTDGYPNGLPPAGVRHAFGCRDGDADGVRDLLTVTATQGPTEIEIEGSYWTIDRGTAVEGGHFVADAAGSVAGGGPQDLMEFLAEEVPAC